tara:strand:+ start:2577 stop:3071 length:495 start_codon:yes stop_codon:yes gene_type:complete
MGDFNPRKVKKISGLFFSEKADQSDFTKPPPTEGYSSRLLPIFAHTSEEPVAFSLNSMSFINAFDPYVYNYLVTLTKKGNLFHAVLRTFLMNGSEEIPFALDEKFFPETQRNDVIDFVSAPSRVFDIEKTHKRVIAFKKFKLITEPQFEEIIEQWRHNPPQTSP